MLDETLRHRVAQIAASDSGVLDDAASERILRHVVNQGPALVRRAQRTRMTFMAAGPALALAAGALLFVRHHPAGGAMPEDTRAVAPSQVAAVGACARRAAPPRGVGFVTESDGAYLDLGAVANATAEPNTDVHVTEAAQCRTVLTLGMGRVTVHAKDLGGGELRVRARDGEVTVHGTIFSVTQTSESLVVEVAEGRVSVKDRGGEHTVSTGERLLVSSVGIAQGVLSPERAHAVRAAVGAIPVVGLERLQPDTAAVVPQEPAQNRPRTPAEPAPSRPASVTSVKPAGTERVELASVEETEAAPKAGSMPAPAPGLPVDLLGQAEQARHAGDYAAARDLYRRAAAGQGATAEAAWVALARMELSLGHAAQAREATKQRQDHFGQGTLSPESQWIDVRTYRQTGDLARARALAEELVRRYPSSPQARAASQWLSSD
jgi:hypothetical protein